MGDIRPYQKTDYVISFEVMPDGSEVYNFLEDAYYTTESAGGHDIKLIGTRGEEWVIGRDKLPQKYTYTDGSYIDADALEVGDAADIATITGGSAEIVWAEQTQDVVEVATSWGEVLTANRPGIDHGDGDFIVYGDNGGEPDYDNAWVVNGGVFVDTYVEA